MNIQRFIAFHAFHYQTFLHGQWEKILRWFSCHPCLKWHSLSSTKVQQYVASNDKIYILWDHTRPNLPDL